MLSLVPIFIGLVFIITIINSIVCLQLHYYEKKTETLAEQGKQQALAAMKKNALQRIRGMPESKTQIKI